MAAIDEAIQAVCGVGHFVDQVVQVVVESIRRQSHPSCQGALEYHLVRRYVFRFESNARSFNCQIVCVVVFVSVGRPESLGKDVLYRGSRIHGVNERDAWAKCAPETVEIVKYRAVGGLTLEWAARTGLPEGL